MDEVPTFSDLAKLHKASASLNLVGSVEHRHGTTTGAIDAANWTFRHAPADKWKIERDGVLQYISDGETSGYLTANGMRQARQL